MYADVTAVTITAANNVELETRLQYKFTRTAECMERNLLTVNASKTKIMFFGTTYTLSNIAPPPNIRSNDEVIEIVDKFKYLGVILDGRLTFTHHVRQKSIGRIKMLGKVRPMTTQMWSLIVLVYKTVTRQCTRQ